MTSGRGCLHPKAEWLVAKMASWSTAEEGGGRRKGRALVLIAGDFTTISAEVMNALNAVSGLSTCVFALAPKHPGDMEYLQEVETRWVMVTTWSHTQLRTSVCYIVSDPLSFPFLCHPINHLPCPSPPLPSPHKTAALFLSCNPSLVHCRLLSLGEDIPSN